MRAIIEYMCGRSLTEEEYNKCVGRLTKYVKRNSLFDRSLNSSEPLDVHSDINSFVNMAILDKIKENIYNVNDISCGRPDEAFIMGRDLTFGETFQKMNKPIVISSVMAKYRSESTRRQIENNAEDIVSKLLSIPKIISTSSIFLYEYEKFSHYGCHITIDIESCKTGYEASRVLFSIISILSCVLSAFSIQFNIILDKSSETWRINSDPKIISLFREQITESSDLIRLLEFMCDRTLSDSEYERCSGRLLNSFDRIRNR